MAFFGIFIFFLFVTHSWSATVNDKSPLRNGITYYEPLTLGRHQAFRRGSDDAPEHREMLVSLQFSAYGRFHDITLKKVTDLFPEDLEFPADFDKHAYYTGSIDGVQGSIVSFSIQQTGEFKGVIMSNDHGTYYIDPVSKHFSGAEPADFNHIIYRDVDVLSGVQVGPIDSVVSTGAPRAVLDANDKQSKRDTVPSPSLNNSVCPMILYASHSFFLANGATVTSALQAMIDRFLIAKDVFANNPVFYSSSTMAVKLQFANWKVETFKNQYFTDPPSPTPQTFLDAVSRISDISGYCLGHMFTHYDFSGTVGLAWLGSNSSLGGICESYNPTYGYTNCGFTTDITFGANQLYGINGLVTAHEIGHNMGSTHDTNEGAPNYFVMYPFASDGSKSNNNKLSDKSKASIGNVIRGNGNCFNVTEGAVCGNKVVEQTEKCDCGGTGLSAAQCEAVDKCCQTNCTLKNITTECSAFHPVNGVCCNGNTCKNLTGDPCGSAAPCKTARTCTNGECLSASNLPDNTVCDTVTANCSGSHCGNLCFSGSCNKSICSAFASSTQCNFSVGADACVVKCNISGVCLSTGTFANASSISSVSRNTTIYKAASAACEFKAGEPNSGRCDANGVCKLNVVVSPQTDLENILNVALNWLTDNSLFGVGLVNYVWVIIFVVAFICLVSLVCQQRKKRDQRRVRST